MCVVASAKKTRSVKKAATKTPSKTAKASSSKASPAKAPAAKKAAKKVAKKAPAKPPAGKAAAAKKMAKKASAKPAQPAMKKHGPRADFGAPIDGFFAKQPPHLRPILEELRKMVEAAAPDADSSIKWGMPFFSVRGAMMCALGSHKSHVNLILSGPPGTYADPEGRLEGDGKTGRRLKLTALEELPKAAVRGWLRTAAEVARAGK